MPRYNIENLAPDHLATIIGWRDADAETASRSPPSLDPLGAPARPARPARATRTQRHPPRRARSARSSPASTSGARTTTASPDGKILASTISKWQQPVDPTLFLTGDSNAKAEAQDPHTPPNSSRGTSADSLIRRTRPAGAHGHHPHSSRQARKEAGRGWSPKSNREEGDGQGAVGGRRRA